MHSYSLRTDENSFLKIKILPRRFYELPTLELAKQLLGCLIIKETNEGVTSGYIVEVEAYLGAEDKAAHSFQNRRTKRTEVMFGEAGYAYTYKMHTHCLVNVVSGEKEKPEAILIRGVQPLSGLDLMKARRGSKIKNMQQLTNGPGKLTKAMGITMEDYGHPYWKPPLIIGEGITPKYIATGKRIGIDNSGEAKDYPFRFWIKNNPFVSK